MGNETGSMGADRAPARSRGADSDRSRSWRYCPMEATHHPAHSEGGERQDQHPAHKVNRLTPDERRALRRSGLSDDQIEAVSLVGIGADEVHELMLRGLGPRTKSSW